MLIRIALIFAVVFGLAAIGVNLTKVSGRIEGLTTTLATTQKDLADSKASENKAKKEARDQAAEVAKTRDALQTTKEELSQATFKVAEQEKRATDAEAKLLVTTKDKEDAQTRLAKWNVFGKTPEEIAVVLIQNKQFVSERDALSRTNQVLARRIDGLQQRLNKYEDPLAKVELPVGLKGKIVAVDPKFDFVVLNIGQEQGVRERGELLVNRGGKLVGKLRVLSVQPNRSIANVLPDWAQAEPMEGDTVIVGL